MYVLKGDVPIQEQWQCSRNGRGTGAQGHGASGSDMGEELEAVHSQCILEKGYELHRWAWSARA